MSGELTPMMRQYRSIRGGLAPDIILLFRLGDFYEMFFEDAKEAAPILDITLTHRNSVPMCGVPYHSVDSYIAKLVKAGKKIAICDQVEDPATAKGIVRREIDRIITPGTAISEEVLESGRHNYLMALCPSGKTVGSAVLDLSTGLFCGEHFEAETALRDAVSFYHPSECLVPESFFDAAKKLLPETVRITSAGDWTFEYETARDYLLRHFKVHSLDGYGCEGVKDIAGAAGALLYYVQDQLKHKSEHIRGFSLKRTSDHMIIDETTRINLDLVGKISGVSLMQILDVTKTAMGARKLRDWILQPLFSKNSLSERHDAVEEFIASRQMLAEFRETLAGVRDIERLLARAGSSTGNPRDVSAIGISIARIPALKEVLGSAKSSLLKELQKKINPLPELESLIKRAIVDEPPFSSKEGGMICEGFNADLDELRNIATSARTWLASYQVQEQSRTGIKTLKVRHNRVFGYYIEVSKGQLDNVPADYVRKQTLVNAERFITPELKKYEDKILGAQDKANALEYELFLTVREEVLRNTAAIQELADAVASLDVLGAYADRAMVNRYVRPVMDDSDILEIVDGRHPVIESLPTAERFIPNDAYLDCSAKRLAIITGPNMAGKSTFIRQVALITLMAQAGSFVPASRARIGIVDRIFTRVGASDDLTRGRSTFMVEMQETANILNNATSRSLIVLDEIGRGTSTFDGISLAWAVAEHIHNQIKCRSLFATHYHELTDLALTLSGVKNYNILVKESGKEIVFLRKIADGAADKSYGIHVGRLAGLPESVIDRANEILANLEEGEIAESGQPIIAKRRSGRSNTDGNQLSFF